MFDVVAIGELLIDFTTAGSGENKNPVFEMNPGGAPANCLASLSALGAKTAFIGKVGDDRFGDFLTGALQQIEVNTSGISKTNITHTTLAFVHLNNNGERNFTFLRKPGADILLTRQDINLSLIDKSSIFHFGSLSLTDEPVRQAVLYAVQYAKKKGKLVSYDPNYRPLLWNSEFEAVKWMRKGMEYADIVKLSEEELNLITGCKDIETATGIILEAGAEKVFVTLGENGAFYMNRAEKGYVPAFKIIAVDTTGCGDAFMGAILYKLTHCNETALYDMVRFANAAGALCATKKGGVPAMPKLEEINKLI